MVINMQSVWSNLSPVNLRTMCYCWWPLYGFSQTSQNTLVVLGPVGTMKKINKHNWWQGFGSAVILFIHKFYSYGLCGRVYWQTFKWALKSFPIKVVMIWTVSVLVRKGHDKSSSYCLQFVTAIFTSSISNVTGSISHWNFWCWDCAHLRVSESLWEPHHEHQVSLDHSDTRQVLAVFCHLLLLLVLFLLLLVLYPLDLLLWQRLVYSGVLWVRLHENTIKLQIEISTGTISQIAVNDDELIF